MRRQKYLRSLNRGQRIVESAKCEDSECFVCGTRGEGDPCGICRELAVLALGGNSKSAAELAARSGRLVAPPVAWALPEAHVRPASKALLNRVWQLGRAVR